MAVIHERTVGTERTIDLGYATLVASASEPGSWHEVRDGRCTCPGFAYRGRCRHLEAAQAITLPMPTCTACGRWS